MEQIQELKRQLIQASILPLSNFDIIFEVECDVSNEGIRVVISQEERPIAFFSEKLNNAKLKYSTYDKEFDVIVQALDHWSNYLFPK